MFMLTLIVPSAADVGLLEGFGMVSEVETEPGTPRLDMIWIVSKKIF